MRVLHCTDTYPPQVNGVSVVTALAVDGLLERGVDVGLVAPSYPRDAPSVFTSSREPSASHRLPACDFPLYPGLRLCAPNMWDIERFARRFKPDLVHADTEFIVGRLGARVARRLGVPLVTSFHTDFAQYTEAYGLPWLREPVTRSLMRFHAAARRVYTPSSVTGGWLAARGLRHVEVWGRAVDTAAFHPTRHARAWRTRLGIDEGTTVFLHVGRLAPEKNVQAIIDGFAIARQRLGLAARLIIAGDGPSAAALRAAAPAGVDFVGFIDRAHDLPSLYASADAFVCASTTETLGLVILEAMASGLPVIAAAAGGIADHLRHCSNGLAVTPQAGNLAAAMLELASKPTLRARLGVNARAWAVDLGWPRELDRLARSYAEVIAGANAATTPQLSSRALAAPLN